MLDNRKAWYCPRNQAHREINWSDKKKKGKGFGLRSMGYWVKTSGHFIHGINTLKG